jgi:hypothetical protein
MRRDYDHRKGGGNMGSVHQIRKPINNDQIPNLSEEPLNKLAGLISAAQECEGYFEPDEVLELAAAAKEAVESLLSDIEQATREAFQDAVMETFLDKGNA